MTSFEITDRAAIVDAADPLVGRVAGQIADSARSRSPRGATGRLAQGWRVVRDEAGERRIVNAVPYARFVEYGTQFMPAQGMLGAATAAAKARYG